MTHELIDSSEAEEGPEHDHTLPDAIDIPVSDGPFDLSPALVHDQWEED